MKRCFFLVLAHSLFFVKAEAQKQTSVYLGTNYTISWQNHSPRKITYEEALRALGAGQQGNLNYRTVQIPIVSSGYLFKRSFRRFKSFGLSFGIELNSGLIKKQVIQDAGYNEYYTWWGVYPHTGEQKSNWINAYVNAGLHYRKNKFVFAAGLSSGFYERLKYKESWTYTDFFFDRLLHTRVSYDFSSSYSIYLNLRTSLFEEYYVRDVYAGIGIQYSFKERRYARFIIVNEHFKK